MEIVTVYVYAEGHPQAGQVCHDASLHGTNEVVMYRGSRQELDGLGRFMARSCNGNQYMHRTSNTIRQEIRCSSIHS